jgi:predicted glycogen debranching enzyme
MAWRSTSDRKARFRLRRTTVSSMVPLMDGVRSEIAEVDVRPRIALSRHVAGDAAEGTRREWVAATGWGDYALGTASLIATRRYHGMLVGATRAPIARRMLVPFVDEELTIDGVSHNLGARRWTDGSIDPDGHRLLAGFALEGSTPTWTYEIGAARLEKRLVMLREERAIALIWTLVDAPSDAQLEVRVFVEHRGHHQLDPDATWLPTTTIAQRTAGDHLATITLPANAQADSETTLFVAATGSPKETLATPHANWWRRHALHEERARGYDAVGSACHALSVRLSLRTGSSQAVVIGLSPAIASMHVEPHAILTNEAARQRTLLTTAKLERAPSELRSLVLAADTFIVRRARRDGSEGRSILAGFPWFEDWGRDAMIALPGLLLHTGRVDEAKLVIETFLDHLSEGLLPNRFPDETNSPEYHSADAPLLTLVAAMETWRASADGAWLARIAPSLLSIVDHYERGTRHGIGIDTDGLVRAGELGLQLTWMDAKVQGTVVTPRAGKPIELSALWIEALRHFESALRSESRARDLAAAERLAALAARAESSFSRFWHEEAHALRDVLECTDIADGAGDLLRPNQLFALASRRVPLDSAQRRKALARISAALATPLAVRTLPATHPQYRGRYEGDQRSRDFAYHNGTAWPFLAGVRLRAEFILDEVRGEKLARLLLEDLAGQLRDGGIGSIAEICDGDPPHDSRGCPMQAWSVGCILDALCTACGEGCRA